MCMPSHEIMTEHSKMVFWGQATMQDACEIEFDYCRTC
jgi:hypothetical protein